MVILVACNVTPSSGVVTFDAAQEAARNATPSSLSPALLAAGSFVALLDERLPPPAPPPATAQSTMSTQPLSAAELIECVRGLAADMTYVHRMLFLEGLRVELFIVLFFGSFCLRKKI